MVQGGFDSGENSLGRVRGDVVTGEHEASEASVAVPHSTQDGRRRVKSACHLTMVILVPLPLFLGLVRVYY